MAGVMPVFERLDPQQHAKEDNEVHHTEMPPSSEGSEEDKVPPIEEV